MLSAVQNGEFFSPDSHYTPSLRVNHFEFLDELFNTKARVLGLSDAEDFVILAYVGFTLCQHVTEQTDGETDGRLDNSTIAIIS